MDEWVWSTGGMIGTAEVIGEKPVADGFRLSLKWREAMHNSECKTCVSFAADQSTTSSIARHSQTGILAEDSSANLSTTKKKIHLDWPGTEPQDPSVRNRPLAAWAMTQRLQRDKLTVPKFDELIFFSINALSPILSQISPLHTLPSHAVQICFRVTLPATFRLPSDLCF